MRICIKLRWFSASLVQLQAHPFLPFTVSISLSPCCFFTDTDKPTCGTMVPPIIHHLLAFPASYLPVKLRADLWQRLVPMGQRSWSPESASQRILGGMYVKRSFLGGLEEGEAMRFVATHAKSIPVPFVIDNLVYGEGSYLVMSRLPGKRLEIEHYIVNWRQCYA